MAKRPKKPTTPAPSSASPVQNSLTEFSMNLMGSPFNTPQISQTNTLFKNNRWYLVSNFRQLLSELYVEHGIIQTLIDQPVDDAFRSGFEIKTGELDGEDIEDIEAWIEQTDAMTALKAAMKWARLYGGGAVLILTDQNPELPFSVDTLKQGDAVEFRAVDMWELYYTYVGKTNLTIDGGDVERVDNSIDNCYDYYGHKIHRSRVLRIEGRQAPSFVRPRLRGWGMSEVERVVRSFNQYLKNQDVVFELLDEAKIDVYKIEGFNTALMTSAGSNQVSSRVQIANQLKNFLNAITMDTTDEYEQKQMSFAGLGDMLVQIRQGIASDLKIPVTKLFGVSSAGFNSGEDDIENYNSMLEGEIRSKCKRFITELLRIGMQVKFGIAPDDIKITFNPLRILSAEGEETVKDRKFRRLHEAYINGAIDRKTWAQGVNKASLLPVEVDENAEALPPVNISMSPESGQF